MLATSIRSFFYPFRGATEIQLLTTFTFFLCRSWHPVQMKTTPGQHWPLLSCSHFLLQSTSWSSLVSRWRAPGRITRGKGSCAHDNFSRFHLWTHTSMHSVEEHCKPVQTHTMRVILHSSERLSHPQSTRLHASATEPEKSCTYLVSSLEPFPSVCRLCTSEKGRLVGREGVHCAPPSVYPGCTQAWLVALSHYRREPTSSQRTAYTCPPTETNLTSSNFL